MLSRLEVRRWRLEDNENQTSFILNSFELPSPNFQLPTSNFQLPTTKKILFLPNGKCYPI
ncbi:hypothetical protein J3D55_001876 [Chryseobacterium ginsenosidimutans]|nr:hypothetical protein [Chryseobacterium ginsenosidimutans]